MDDFIRDGTALWGDKSNFGGREPSNPTKQWSADDAALVKAALLSVQAYLRAGTLDAALTTTIPTATITTATVGAAVIGDLNLTANTDPAVGPEMDWVGFNGRWFVGIDVANAPTSRDFVLTGVRRIYSLTDGATTNGSPTLTSASGGGFTTALIGATIGGSGIPASTTITAVAGATSLTMSASATATATNVRVSIVSSTVQDLAYWKHRGTLSPTLGIGITPPDGSARLQVSAEDNEVAMGTMRLRVGPSQTGKALTVYDSGAADRWWVTSDFYVSGNHPIGGAMVVQSTAASPGPTDARALVMVDSAKSNAYGFTFQGGNAITFRAINGGADSWKSGSDGLFTVQGSMRGTGARAAAPSSGTHVAGEIVFNADPIASGKVGWVCVTGGTPGTWKAWGAIDP